MSQDSVDVVTDFLSWEICWPDSNQAAEAIEGYLRVSLALHTFVKKISYHNRMIETISSLNRPHIECS